MHVWIYIILNRIYIPALIHCRLVHVLCKICQVTVNNRGIEKANIMMVTSKCGTGCVHFSISGTYVYFVPSKVCL